MLPRCWTDATSHCLPGTPEVFVRVEYNLGAFRESFAGKPQRPDHVFSANSYCHLMWSWALVCGLFADNVGLLSVNLVLKGVLFAANVVQKRPLFVVQNVFVCGPLQVGNPLRLVCLRCDHQK